MPEGFTQRILYETDLLEDFGTVLEVMAKTLFQETPSKYKKIFLTRKPGLFDYGIRDVARPDGNKVKSKPRYKYLCSIGDFMNEFSSNDWVFESYGELIKRVIMIAKATDTDTFFNECGYGNVGDTDTFNPSVSMGYRMSSRFSNSNSLFLDISLCHIYHNPSHVPRF